MCVCVHLDPIPCHWGVESGDVGLVSGQGHTNNVCCLHATPENLLSLGLDKSLKTTSLATNEFRSVLSTSPQLCCVHVSLSVVEVWL